jgi:adenylate cyclase
LGEDVGEERRVGEDAVNLASRLEGTNKEYETRILLSEATHVLVAGKLNARRLGAVRVKGKRKPVRIYELRGLEPAQGKEAETIGRFESAVDAYTAAKFDEAAEGFRSVLSVWPTDAPSKRYLAEIEVFKTEPPAQGWDGVYTATTK